MSKRNLFSVTFAGLTVKFVLPTAIRIPKQAVPFLCADSVVADIEYQVVLLEQPLQLSSKPLAIVSGIQVYQYGKHWLRVYVALTAKDGCQAACLLRENGKHTLYYPASRWEFYSIEWNFLHLVGIETVLLQYDALILHSSVVQMHNQAVLFSGPSGIGKSTQAALWEKYLGADILNGDRCIIRKKFDGFYGCGSPWCGTSGIYRQEQAKIKGIFLLRQGKENSVRSVGAEAFVKIFQHCIVNMWDGTFVMKLTDLIVELLEQVPVYELECRPGKEAVQLAYKTLFGGGI